MSFHSQYCELRKPLRLITVPSELSAILDAILLEIQLETDNEKTMDGGFII